MRERGGRGESVDHADKKTRREALVGIGAVVASASLAGCEVQEQDAPDAEDVKSVQGDSSHITEKNVKIERRQNEEEVRRNGRRPAEEELPHAIEDTEKKERVEQLLDVLDYKNIAALDEEQVGSYMSELYQAVELKQLSSEKIRRAIFPPNDYAVNLYYSDKHVTELQKEARSFKGDENPYRKKVREVAGYASGARLWAAKHLRVFSEYARCFGSDVNWTEREHFFNDPSRGQIAGRLALRMNHLDALDIFYDVKKEGQREIGPELQTISGGIVVAADGNWSGGTETDLYEGGGLSPKSGNAVVVYNPESNELFYYAHLDSIGVAQGDIVRAGDRIGVGGNTGYKARRNGRGRHVHFEIHRFNIQKNKHEIMDVFELADMFKRTKISS